MSGINSNLFIISMGKIVRFIEECIFFSPEYKKVLGQLEKNTYLCLPNKCYE